MVILQNSHSVQWRPCSPCPHVCDPGWVLLAHICNATNGHLPHQCPIFIVFLVYHEGSVVDNSSTYLFTHSLTISFKQKMLTQSCLMAMIYIGSGFVLTLINLHRLLGFLTQRILWYFGHIEIIFLALFCIG